MKPLPVIHLDGRVCVVDKPAGLVVHKSARAGDRDTCMRALRGQLGRHVYPVHRLDRGCSGALAFALDPEAAASLMAAFAAREVGKSYLAVVRGFPPETGRVERALADERHMLQDAATSWQRLATAEVAEPIGFQRRDEPGAGPMGATPFGRYPTARYALVRAWPETGRQHQLRRHFAGLGHPILGDANHGDLRHNRFVRAHFGFARLALHAERLELPHPDGFRRRAEPVAGPMGAPSQDGRSSAPKPPDGFRRRAEPVAGPMGAPSQDGRSSAPKPPDGFRRRAEPVAGPMGAAPPVGGRIVALAPPPLELRLFFEALGWSPDLAF